MMLNYDLVIFGEQRTNAENKHIATISVSADTMSLCCYKHWTLHSLVSLCTL